MKGWGRGPFWPPTPLEASAIAGTFFALVVGKRVNDIINN